MTDSSTLLSLQVTNGSPQGDSLFFITTDPASINGGACAADALFSTGDAITTPGGEMPVTSEEFPACVSDIAALKSAYLALCP
jgi:hypothetical protein